MQAGGTTKKTAIEVLLLRFFRVFGSILYHYMYNCLYNSCDFGRKIPGFKNLSGAEKKFCITVALEICSGAINANPALIQGQEVHLYNHIRC